MRTADNRRNLEHLANGVYAEVENGVEIAISNETSEVCLTKTHLKKEGEE